MKRTTTLFFFLALTSPVHSQSGCLATITLDHDAVYVQQPLKITVTILTATWFTAPPEWTPIAIPDAFVLHFDQTTPGMFTQNGKQYAGIQFYFIVFPYKTGSYDLPEIPITLHSPPPGSSVSRLVTIHTPPRNFTVRPVPAGDKENWLVAKSISVSQQWSHSADTLRVGDILKRTITIDAHGTLPQFIPPLQKPPLAFAATYGKDPKLTDLRNSFDANGRLEQPILYLLEKPGAYTIPSITINWWNPISNKWYSRTAAGRPIYVKPNPDLGMLTTLKDSLDAQQHSATPTPRPPLSHIAPTVFIFLLTLYLIYKIIRILPGFLSRFKDRRAAWLAGELWAFRHFMRSPLETRSLTRSLYQWFDQIRPPGGTFALSDYLKNPQRARLREEFENNLHTLYASGTTGTRTSRDIKKAAKAWRKEIKSTGIHREKPGISPMQQTV
jgi:hypothetical protein